jgi:collagenase-like PrtC family protease
MALKDFTSQAEEKILKELKNIAKLEGKKLYALVNEALNDLVEKRKQGTPRKEVLAQFEASLSEYASLYEKLAK